MLEHLWCNKIWLFQSCPASMPGNQRGEALRLHCHLQAVSNETKSSSLVPCHHPCHIKPQRSTSSSQRGFLLKYINLGFLSCHYSNWNLMYLPQLLSPPLPLPLNWYWVVLASPSMCPLLQVSPGQSAAGQTCHLSGVFWIISAQCLHLTLHPGAFP